ncbi:MarR family winged helix-turn-helix transcriptional regulator [Polycladidibacter stylochi]|uniref:MarR family winged helix-turn-helix transcriptional regulator n=1 Tax=Polycladidibacter stylochi TaxID=1807766 RepID=UPI000831B48E|nr:MarR family transcriptional regulator [Pseudovibrio stylochi]
MSDIFDVAKEPKIVGLHEHLCFALYSATHMMNRVYKPHLDALGLTYPQFLVLVVLRESDNITVREIGHKLQLESSTLTPLLKRLEKAEIVVRRRDEKDERLVRIELSDKGRTLLPKIDEMVGCVFETTGLSEKAAQQLGDDIRQLRDNLKVKLQTK